MCYLEERCVVPRKIGPLEKFLGLFHAFSRTLVVTPELECHSKENGEKRNTLTYFKRYVEKETAHCSKHHGNLFRGRNVSLSIKLRIQYTGVKLSSKTCLKSQHLSSGAFPELLYHPPPPAVGPLPWFRDIS
jgi:hypothetical protein